MELNRSQFRGVVEVGAHRKKISVSFAEGGRGGRDHQ